MNPAPGEGRTDLRLGLLVPFRNEAPVLERKLRNLAGANWPDGPRPHRLVLVDDGSDDGGFELAAGLCARLFAPGAGAGAGQVDVAGSGPRDAAAARVSAEVVRNAQRPGKAGAIHTGLAALRGDVDLVVLSDADVIVRPDALQDLAARFAGRPGLGMACGRQRFVRSLASNGSCRGADGGELVDAGDAFDRATARVRAWESARGRLFSVHGQLLAWREGLGLAPSPGLAADDLDLMFQVRERGLRVELLPEATFLEVKVPAGPSRQAQALRRARAWFQVMEGRRSPPGAPAFDRLQLAFYRTVPWLAAPATHAVVALGLLGFGAAGAVAIAGPTVPKVPAALAGAGFALVVLLAGIVSPLGRLARALSSQWPVIRAARTAGTQGFDDRWDGPAR